MKCKQAEKLILESLPEGLDTKVKTELENHLSQCPECTTFRKNWQLLHQGIKKTIMPSPSVIITEQTRVLCHRELDRQKMALPLAATRTINGKAPILIWLAVIVLFVLTLTWGPPIFQNYFNAQIIDKQVIYFIFILSQNLITLLLAPILIRYFTLRNLEIDQTRLD